MINISVGGKIEMWVSAEILMMVVMMMMIGRRRKDICRPNRPNSNYSRISWILLALLVILNGSSTIATTSEFKTLTTFPGNHGPVLHTILGMSELVIGKDGEPSVSIAYPYTGDTDGVTIQYNKKDGTEIGRINQIFQSMVYHNGTGIMGTIQCGEYSSTECEHKVVQTYSNAGDSISDLKSKTYLRNTYIKDECFSISEKYVVILRTVGRAPFFDIHDIDGKKRFTMNVYAEDKEITCFHSFILEVESHSEPLLIFLYGDNTVEEDFGLRYVSLDMAKYKRDSDTQDPSIMKIFNVPSNNVHFSIKYVTVLYNHLVWIGDTTYFTLMTMPLDTMREYIDKGSSSVITTIFRDSIKHIIVTRGGKRIQSFLTITSSAIDLLISPPVTFIAGISRRSSELIFLKDIFNTTTEADPEGIIFYSDRPSLQASSNDVNQVDWLTVKNNSLMVALQGGYYDYSLYDMCLGKTCTECGDNPYCGYCALSAVCTSLDQCAQEVGVSPKSWIQDSSNCPVFHGITIDQEVNISVDISETVLLSVSNLPRLNETSEGYKCGVRVTKDIIMVTAKRLNSSLISCELPIFTQSIIPEGQTDMKANISIFYEGVDLFPNIVANIILYSCRRNDDCKLCTASSYKCKWCIYSTECTPEHKEECKVPVFDATISILSSELCPVARGPAISEIYHDEEEKSFIISGTNLPEPQEQFQYFCDFDLFSVKGEFFNGSIDCGNPAKLLRSGDFNVQSMNITNVGLTLADHPIPLSYEHSLSIYSCRIVGDCTSCNQSEIWFGSCGYCHGACSAVCESGTEVKVCPFLKLRDFTPRYGPIAGGTKVKILGSDIPAFVSVAIGDVPCALIQRHSSEEITCTTAKMAEPVNNAAVTVENDSFKSETFDFRANPTLDNIAPLISYYAGGGILNVSGSGFMAGSQNIKAYVGQHECANLSISEKHFTCVFPAMDAPAHVRISITLDSNNFTSSRSISLVDQFTCDGIFPEKVSVSGVIGKSQCTGLLVKDVPFTVRFVKSKGRRSVSDFFDSSAEVLDENSLQFEYPNLPQGSYRVQFISGDIIVDKPNTTVTVYPKPSITDFIPRSLPMQLDGLDESGRRLLIKGSNLGWSWPYVPIHIEVAGAKCRITSVAVSMSELFCVIDKAGNPSGYVTFSSAETYLDTSNLKDGEFSFNEASPDEKDFPIILVACCAGGALLLGIILLIVIRRRGKRKQVKMLYDMEALETRNNVIMKDTVMMANNVFVSETSSPFTKEHFDHIPYRSQKAFLSQLVHENRDITAGLPASSSSFSANLWTTLFPKNGSTDDPKHFQVLLIVLRTLEGHLSTAERSLAGKLLLLSLIDQPSYATEVLKAMVSDALVQLEDEDKTSNKDSLAMFLRENRFIVEKYTTAWLVLTNYDYVKSTIGDSIYQLVIALARGITQGRITADNERSEKTLNVQMLLRDVADYKKIHIKVKTIRNTIVPVEVLSCDTVAQLRFKVGLAQLEKASDARKHSETKLLTSDGSVLLDNEMSTLSSYGIEQGDTIVEKEHNGDYDEHDHVVQKKKKTGKFGKGSLRLLDSSSTQSLIPNPEYYEAPTQSVPFEIVQLKILPLKHSVAPLIEELFDVIVQSGRHCGPAIKIISELFDEKAQKMGNPQLANVWKSNSIFLRFFNELILAPNALLDVQMPPFLSANMSIVSSLLMRALNDCDDVPITKPAQALWNKEVFLFSKWFNVYYSGISKAKKSSPNDLKDIYSECTTTSTSVEDPTVVSSGDAFAVFSSLCSRYSSSISAALSSSGVDSKSVKLFK